jgi:Secretion system C-terminal sorting domain
MKIKLVQYSFAIITLCIAYFTLSSYSNTGGSIMSGNSQSGCSCHGAANNATTITITGMPNGSGYTINQVYPVTITVSSAGKLAAGINLNVSNGTVSNLGANLTLVGTTGLRHSSPKPMAAGTTTFTFDWKAPAVASGAVNLYVSANATNNNSANSGDAWVSNSLSVPLSVSYLQFDVLCKANEIRLYWSTQLEKEIKMFVVEKSIDGYKFDSLSLMIANGDANTGRNYDYADFPAYTNTYYYRLKIVSNNGSFSYSPVIKANFDNGATFDYIVFPNPAKHNTDININVFNNKNNYVAVSLIDLKGTTVYSYKYKAIKGTNYFTIPNTFNAGYYTLKVSPEFGNTSTKKVVLQ